MKIVSACLAGIECRFDCKSKTSSYIVEMIKKGEAIPLCPEQLGGLSTPRTPAEIINEKVIDKNGEDVTSNYQIGAEQALNLALLSGASEAFLKSKSPMCGIDQIYDGTFTGNLVEGDGIFVKLLKEKGIKVTKVD